MPTNITRTDATSSTLTFAEQMVAKLQAEILAGSSGVVQTTIDGTTVQVSRNQMLKELTKWQKEVARANGTQPLAPTIDLNHANDS
jgi:hypothetical protein|tara:strand:- start:3558 stop:3815 length:258 start_codon:yes stop_codon:yes gene_type:complete